MKVCWFSRPPMHLGFWILLFCRPGRFDRMLFVPPPDLMARATILQILLKSRPQIDLDLQELAAATDGFSAADLKALVDIAIEGKLSEVMQHGVPAALTMFDLRNVREDKSVNRRVNGLLQLEIMPFMPTPMDAMTTCSNTVEVPPAPSRAERTNYNDDNCCAKNGCCLHEPATS